jgi:hypothetical protein
MKPRKCPECGAAMDGGHVEMKSDTTVRQQLADCWFVSNQDKEWLVLPFHDRKEAYRCLQCGTTLILRGS